jgi:hypothetical protein
LIDGLSVTCAAGIFAGGFAGGFIALFGLIRVNFKNQVFHKSAAARCEPAVALKGLIRAFTNG